MLMLIVELTKNCFNIRSEALRQDSMLRFQGEAMMIKLAPAKLIIFEESSNFPHEISERGPLSVGIEVVCFYTVGIFGMALSGPHIYACICVCV